MVSPQYYWITYYLFIGIVLILYLVGIKEDLKLSNQRNLVKCIVLGCILILFFGLRPISGRYLGDTLNYAIPYSSLQSGQLEADNGMENGILDLKQETGFAFIRNTLALSGFDVSIWFLIVALIYVGTAIWAIHRIFPGYEYVVFLFLISSFGFYSGGINGIRNADACSIFFLGFSFFALKNKNILIAAVLFLMAFSFHHSVIISIVSFLSSYYVIKNTKGALLIWFGAIIISLVFGNTIANYAVGLNIDERASTYLNYAQDSDFMKSSFSHTGFRWDFLLFSALPIAIGYYTTVIRGIKDHTYQLLLNTYIIANAIWVIFMYAAFTNRYAALSWALYPYLLCYPFLKFKIWNNNNWKYLAYGLIGQFIFCLIFDPR